jgi:hypothetical protein
MKNRILVTMQTRKMQEIAKKCKKIVRSICRQRTTRVFLGRCPAWNSEITPEKLESYRNSIPLSRIVRFFKSHI